MATRTPSEGELTQESLSFERGIEIVHLEGDVRHRSHKLGDPAVRFKPHPLDAVGTSVGIPRWW
jgi:hypothetical protein